MGLIDRIRDGTYRPDADPPLVVPGTWPTLREVADRVRAGSDPLLAIRDFLDAAQRCDDDTLAALVRDDPGFVDPRTDALLGAVAEHVLVVRGLSPCRWSSEPGRFLDRFWFVSAVPGLRAAAIAQTPVAFKRRGIMWPARSLVRV